MIHKTTVNDQPSPQGDTQSPDKGGIVADDKQWFRITKTAQRPLQEFSALGGSMTSAS